MSTLTEERTIQTYLINQNKKDAEIEALDLSFSDSLLAFKGMVGDKLAFYVMYNQDLNGENREKLIVFLHQLADTLKSQE